MAKPKNFKQIQDAVRFHRAKERCECSGLWGCNGNHYGRCPAVHGITPTGEQHPANLTVTQIKHRDDWSPEALVALCKPCLADVTAWRKKQDDEEDRMKARAAESESMFPDLEPIEPRDEVRAREEN